MNSAILLGPCNHFETQVPRYIESSSHPTLNARYFRDLLYAFLHSRRLYTSVPVQSKLVNARLCVADTYRRGWSELSSDNKYSRMLALVRTPNSSQFIHPANTQQQQLQRSCRFLRLSGSCYFCSITHNLFYSLP